MRTHLVFLALLVGCSSHAAAQPGCSGPERTALEQVISTTIAGFPSGPDTGIAVAVIKDNKSCYSGGFGLRDREASAKVEAETFFPIGSATKSFTSMAISMLAEDGKIKLDTPIKSYLPDFGMKDPQAADTTLEDILSHRTGLRRHDALWYLGSFSTHQLLHRVQHLNPGGPFRNSYEYNNMLVAFAGLVLKAKGGTSWDDFVRSRILEPLDMKSCTFPITDLSGHKNHAKGYNGLVQLNPQSMENIRPAAEINCNVVELTKWVLLHLNRGVVPGGKRIITTASLDKMYTVHNPSGVDQGVALGWFVTKLDGKRLAFHAGNAEGYTAFVSFMPDHGVATIVLTNQHESRLPAIVAGKVYRHLLPDELRMAAEFLRAGPMIPGEIRMSPKAMIDRRLSSPGGDYTGMYSDMGYGDMSVTLLGNELFLGYYPHRWLLEATPVADKFTFDVEAYGGITREAGVIFYRNGAGKVEALSVPFDIVDRNVRLVRFSKR